HRVLDHELALVVGLTWIAEQRKGQRRVTKLVPAELAADPGFRFRGFPRAAIVVHGLVDLQTAAAPAGEDKTAFAFSSGVASPKSGEGTVAEKERAALSGFRAGL